MSIAAELKIKDRTAEALVRMRDLTKGSFEHLAQEMVAWLKVTTKPQGPPVLTGNLRDQIDYEEAGGLAFRVTAATGYSFWVVVGSSKRPGNDFYGRAYRAVEDLFGGQPN